MARMAALVGREREQSRLRRAIADAAGGAGTFVVVRGEPGIGKTALVRWAVDEVQDDGWWVLRGNAHPSGAHLSYGPIVEAVGRLLRGIGPEASTELTAGIGTTYVLVYNGIHIGAVAGWMSYQGQGRALWGWILPHGGTELLAICLAGAAGYLLADAMLAPGIQTRLAALQQAGLQALKIEVGCMVMLIFAGFIEGFISPSSLPFLPRIGILVVSLGLWAAYFLQAGRGLAAPCGEQD